MKTSRKPRIPTTRKSKDWAAKKAVLTSLFAPEAPTDPFKNHLSGEGEVRVVDPTTGGAKGQKLAQLGAIDPLALIELAKVAGYGTRKHDRMNFMKGYTWALSTDALFRHFLAFLNGEQNDPESGLPHMAHAAWHALALTTFS